MIMNGTSKGTVFIWKKAKTFLTVNATPFCLNTATLDCQ